MDPNGQTWYGEMCHFVNSLITFKAPFSHVGHIIVGDAYAQLPPNAVIIGDDLQWTKLFTKRCECKVYCCWDRISVPIACSANFMQNQCSDNDKVINLLIQEIQKMQ